MDDLWEQGIGLAVAEETPAMIVGKHAKQLANRTGGVVECVVRRLAQDRQQSGQLIYQVELSCENLDYRYAIFRMKYTAAQYPLNIEASVRFKSDLEKDFDTSTTLSFGNGDIWIPLKIDDENELLRFLGVIFGSATTKRMVNGLVAEARAAF